MDAGSRSEREEQSAEHLLAEGQSAAGKSASSQSGDDQSVLSASNLGKVVTGPSGKLTILESLNTVSYTHLTLPTIYSV